MLPLLFTAMAAYVGWVTFQGFRSGVMEPIGKGLNLAAEREAHGALGADGERALGGLAVDERAAGDAVGARPRVGGVRAVVARLLADDEEQVDAIVLARQAAAGPVQPLSAEQQALRSALERREAPRLLRARPKSRVPKLPPVRHCDRCGIDTSRPELCIDCEDVLTWGAA